jgi:DNA-binding NtrC family response regulator
LRSVDVADSFGDVLVRTKHRIGLRGELNHQGSPVTRLWETMPVMSGEETFQQIRMISPDVRVILSSGYNEVEAIRRFTNKGLAGFIQKPYTAVELARKVKTVLTSERSD